MIEQYLNRLNIKEIKPMQVEALNSIHKGASVILVSPTGSGKTLAFLLPLIGLLDKNQKAIQALIIVPSRELGLQIEAVFKKMQTGYKINTFYGGHPIKTEINNLTDLPAILIGTPGRLADHLRRGNLQLFNLETVILDEFDKSLEFGFTDEMQYIIGNCPNVRTRILTSATNLDVVPDFLKVNNAKIINYSNSQGLQRLSSKYIRAEDTDKLSLLMRLLHYLKSESSIVFCNHREAVERISALLKSSKIPHGIYHGGLEQEKREISLIKFRNGTHHILLTTDLASRGLDVPDIQNIIHYQFPVNETAWIHRNGRTARMNKTGTSWLLLAGHDRLPEYVADLSDLQEVVLNDEPEHQFQSVFETIYIGLGRKDKISKGDIAGFLMQQGLLKKEEIGQIDVLDYASFAAIKKDVIKRLLSIIKDKRIKKKLVRIELAKG